MTLATMLADLYRKLLFSTTPAADVTTRLTSFLNESLQEVISEPGLGAWFARTQPRLTFATVANRPGVALPAFWAGRISGITDADNDRRLEQRSLGWYHAALPDPAAITGTPEAWVDAGYVAVALQPANASEIFVDSTAAGDTGTAYLEGIRTGGYPVSLSVTMTGTTAVTLGAAYTDLIEITKFYLSTAAVGTVTLHEDASGGTELARIPIGQTFSRYHQLLFYPTPASAITYAADGERELPLMTNATDEPPLPLRFHRILVDGAYAKELIKREDDRAEAAGQKFARGIRDLRYFATCPPDYLPVAGGKREAPSRLGAWFPAGAGS